MTDIFYEIKNVLKLITTKYQFSEASLRFRENGRFELYVRHDFISASIFIDDVKVDDKVMISYLFKELEKLFKNK